MSRLVREAVGYAAASGCALIVDLGALDVLVQLFKWWYLAAASVSFLAGMGVAYQLSVRLVFRHRKLEDRRKEFVSFLAIGMVGLTLNAAVIYVAVSVFAIYFLAAKCIAAGFTFVFNFFARRQLLFVPGSSIRNRTSHVAP
jgi:putative flippase GtrA